MPHEKSDRFCGENGAHVIIAGSLAPAAPTPSRSRMAPQLTHGMPVDFSADVPIFPPAATALCALLGVLLWKLTGARLRVLPAPLAGLSFRLAVTAAVAAVSVAVLSRAGNTLKEAGSGTLFTPVGGMATDGPYSFTRNPMYSGLVFAALDRWLYMLVLPPVPDGAA